MVTMDVDGQTLMLLPEKAIFLPESDTLLVADAHFGKATSFRQLGVPVPKGTTEETLGVLTRMNQFFERFESQLRQGLRARADVAGSTTPTVDANAHASVLTSFAVGRLQRYARSGFKRSPTEYLDAALRMLDS